MVKNQAFNDDDICAICLCPLTEQRSITLSCSHSWHLACIQEQLRQAAPSPSRRMVFNGIRCALCSSVCTHPELDAMVCTTAHVLHRVDELIREQAAADRLHEDPAVTNPNSRFYQDVIGYGRFVYAFYICVLCRQPYFGGTVDCADATRFELPPDDQLCPSCSPRPNETCTDTTHAPFHVWKCRFCCRRATFVCHGSTHLCDTCHSLDNPLEHRRRVRVQDRLNIPVTPCPGRPECTEIMPVGEDHHRNGAESKCEQLLECAACISLPVGSRGLTLDERGSKNMLFNPNGASELRGWSPLLRHNATEHYRWASERSDHPFGSCRTNFVSTFSWARMAQAVNLSNFVRDPGTAIIELSARIRSRADCPGLFRLEGALYDASMNELQWFCTDTIQAPPDCWDRVRHTFPPTAGAKFAVIAIHGKDNRFWAGRYGAKVTACSVRVLYDDSVRDPSNVIIEDAFRFISEASTGPGSAIRALSRRAPAHQHASNMTTRIHRHDARSPFWMALYPWRSGGA